MKRVAVVGFLGMLLVACGGGSGGTGGAGTGGGAGTSGGAGTTGEAGSSGAAGTTGTAGTTGAAGTTGGAGTTGAAGTGAAGTGTDGGTDGGGDASTDGGTIPTTGITALFDGVRRSWPNAGAEKLGQGYRFYDPNGGNPGFSVTAGLSLLREYACSGSAYVAAMTYTAINGTTPEIYGSGGDASSTCTLTLTSDGRTKGSYWKGTFSGTLVTKAADGSASKTVVVTEGVVNILTP